MRTTASILALMLVGCVTEPGGMETDGSEDQTQEDSSVDPSTDRDPECIDEADVAFGDVSFVAAECSTDPAVAVIEVTLLTMEIVGWVHTAPATDLPPTEADMIDALREALAANDCDHPLIVWENATAQNKGPFTWVYIPPMDLGAAGLFDDRTGELVFAYPSDYLSWDRRCLPVDPLEPLGTEHAPATAPVACYSAAADCPEEITGLNYWGDYTTCDDGCWFDRTYEQVWEAASHTALASIPTEDQGVNDFGLPADR